MIINDIWPALGLAFKNFFYAVLISLIVSYIFFSIYLFIFLVIIFLVQSIRIYLINSKYEIDIEKKEFIFPRADIENSIIEIILLARYWNLMRKKAIKLADIEKTHISSYRGQWYFLIVTGQFGSFQLEFLSKQKRDEVKSALDKYSKELRY